MKCKECGQEQTTRIEILSHLGNWHIVTDGSWENIEYIHRILTKLEGNLDVGGIKSRAWQNSYGSLYIYREVLDKPKGDED